MKMKVILLEQIPNLGTLGDIVEVLPGYARNFLIPFGKALRATKDNLEKFEKSRNDYLGKLNSQLAFANANKEKIDDKEFTITAKAGVDGKLFGSVTAFDIVEAINKTGITIEKPSVLLPNGPLKTIGTFEIKIKLYHDIHALIKVVVVSE